MHVDPVSSPQPTSHQRARRVLNTGSAHLGNGRSGRADPACQSATACAACSPPAATAATNRTRLCTIGDLEFGSSHVISRSAVGGDTLTARTRSGACAGGGTRSRRVIHFQSQLIGLGQQQRASFFACGEHVRRGDDAAHAPGS